jgi:hypothetical protein
VLGFEYNPIKIASPWRLRPTTKHRNNLLEKSWRLHPLLSLHPMKFEDAKEFSLPRRIVARRLCHEDYRGRDERLPRLRATHAFGRRFPLGRNTTPLPKTYLEVLMGSQEATSLLQIPVGPSYLNCHFFDGSELELDFSPADYSTPEAWDALSTFLQGLADAMQREVIVTPENVPEVVYIRYQPLAGQGSTEDERRP